MVSLGHLDLPYRASYRPIPPQNIRAEAGNDKKREAIARGAGGVPFTGIIRDGLALLFQCYGRDVTSI